MTAVKRCSSETYLNWAWSKRVSSIEVLSVQCYHPIVLCLCPVLRALREGTARRGTGDRMAVRKTRRTQDDASVPTGRHLGCILTL